MKKDNRKIMVSGRGILVGGRAHSRIGEEIYHKYGSPEYTAGEAARKAGFPLGQKFEYLVILRPIQEDK